MGGVGGVGGMNVTVWLLQLSPLQHSILQSSIVMLNCAMNVAFNSAQAAAVSVIRNERWNSVSIGRECFYNNGTV